MCRKRRDKIIETTTEKNKVFRTFIPGPNHPTIKKETTMKVETTQEQISKTIFLPTGDKTVLVEIDSSVVKELENKRKQVVFYFNLPSPITPIVNMQKIVVEDIKEKEEVVAVTMTEELGNQLKKLHNMLFIMIEKPDNPQLDFKYHFNVIHRGGASMKNVSISSPPQEKEKCDCLSCRLCDMLAEAFGVK